MNKNDISGDTDQMQQHKKESGRTRSHSDRPIGCIVLDSLFPPELQLLVGEDIGIVHCADRNCKTPRLHKVLIFFGSSLDL